MAKKQSVAPSNSRTSRSSTASTVASDPPTRGNRKPINTTKPKTVTKGQLNWLRFQSKTVKTLRAQFPEISHTELRKEVSRLWKEKKDAVPVGEEMPDISSDDLTDDDAPADED